MGSASLEQNLRLKTLGYLLFIPVIFLIYCLAAPWQMFNCCWGNSLSHLTSMVYQFLAQSWLGGVGSLHLTECPVIATPKLQKILCSDLNPVFPKCGNAPNTQNSYSLTLVAFPTGKIYVCWIFVEHSHDIFLEYSEKVPYEISGNILK